MKNICFIVILFLSTFSYSLVLEDAEDVSTERWNISQNSLIDNLMDVGQNSRVIEFDSSSYQYHKLIFSQNTTLKNITWEMKVENPFYVYVDITTLMGIKSLYYSPVIGNNLGKNYIHHGIGQSAKDATWHQFNRDIEKDLRDANDANRLISIDGFRIRAIGKVSIDNIKLLENNTSTEENNTSTEENNTSTEENNTSTCINEQLVEDGEDGRINKWVATGNGMITNEYSDVQESKVITFNSSLHQYFKIDFTKNSAAKRVMWEMKASKPFYVYVNVSTTLGNKSLYYSGTNRTILGDNYIHHGIGFDKIDGNWYEILRNIENDLKDANSNNNLLSIDSIVVRSSGTFSIDNIKLLCDPSNEVNSSVSNPSALLNNMEDNISEEKSVGEIIYLPQVGGEDNTGIVYCKWEQNGSIILDENITPPVKSLNGQCNQFSSDSNITFKNVGNYPFIFTVEDENGNSDSIEYNVAILANYIPTANIGLDRTILVGSELNITAVTCDLDANPNENIHDYLNYEWMYGLKNSNVMINKGSSEHFFHHFDTVGVYRIFFKATDPNNAIVEVYVDINVTAMVSNNVNLQNGLIAHYQFEDNAEDISGSNNHGSIHGGAVFIEDGVKGKAISLDGINDYVQVALNSELRFNPNLHSFSVSGWMKPESMPRGCGYVPLIDAYRYHLSNQWLDVKRDFGNNPGPKGSGVGINYKLWDTKKWHLFTGTWQVSGNDVVGRYYIDGILRDEQIVNIVPNGNYAWIGLYIGRSAHCGGGFGKFKADELRIYNRAINQFEVEYIYNELTGNAIIGTP